MTLKGENLEAELFAKWLKSQGYKFTHIANESGLPPRIAMLASMRKKRMGTSPGFPDYCIILKNSALLFIELKKPRTRKNNGEYRALSSDGIEISEEQEKWIEELNKLDNIGACFCFGSEEAKSKVLESEK